ncbi:MAG: hypothetical protein WDW36_000156 [Sanguina aurantia]
MSGSKGNEVKQCTGKCLPTCIRGGSGAPGLGPIAVEKEAVVFKQGFRSRSYCLTECASGCSLAINSAATAAAAASAAALTAQAPS